MVKSIAQQQQTHGRTDALNRWHNGYTLIVQVLRYWPFGALWCRIWLAVDVWLCTASIFNLCAISLDRYIAISRPVKYPAVMSPRRARLLIVCVWILSFVICFPPLIGWNERGGLDFGDDVTGWNNGTRPPPADDVIMAVVQPMYSDYDGSPQRYDVVVDSVTSQRPAIAMVTAAMTTTVPEDQCQLTSVPGYIVYSACGSFWVPMLGMIVFYWKIYKTAVAATDAVNRGFVEQKTTGLFANMMNTDSCTRLRVHRGGTAAATTTQRASQTTSTTSTTKMRHSAGCISELLPQHQSSESLHRSIVRRSVDGRLQTTSATPATLATSASRATAATAAAATASQRGAEVTSQPVPTIVITSSTSSHDNTQQKSTRVDDVIVPGVDCDVIKSAAEAAAAGVRRSSVFRGVRSGKRQSKSCDDVNTQQTSGLLQTLGDSNTPPNTSARTSTSSVTSAAEKRTSLIASRFAKLHIISQLRSLNKEKKAAKTVGIIVGCFMVCWTPFFTVYLAEAFCRHCTPAVLFNVFFWLGYCNSAANPFIYGLCSKDFRYAFQKFLRCRYRRTKPALRHTANSQMMSMLQSLTMQVVAGGTINAAANVSAAEARAKANRRKRN